MAGSYVGLEKGKLIFEIVGAGIGGLGVDVEGLVIVAVIVEGVRCGLVSVGLAQKLLWDPSSVSMSTAMSMCIWPYGFLLKREPDHRVLPVLLLESFLLDAAGFRRRLVGHSTCQMLLCLSGKEWNMADQC